MKKHIALVLSGCGHRDGAEITEATSTLISLDKEGASYECFAPDMESPTVNHLSKSGQNSTRHVMEEAARIARGQWLRRKATGRCLRRHCVSGWSGAAKVLSTWAEKGAKCDVLPDVDRAIRAFIKAENRSAPFVSRGAGGENSRQRGRDRYDW